MTNICINVDDLTYKKFESETTRKSIHLEDAFSDAMNKWLSKNDMEKEKVLNRTAYKKMENELKKKYFGKYAVIVHGKFMGVCDNLKDSWEIARTRVAKHYLILKIGEEHKIARIRGSAFNIKNE